LSQSYNWLRKSANLILNLLSLMGDAGINDISKRSDLPKVLVKVEEKFRLDLTGTTLDGVGCVAQLNNSSEI
jgi:phosphatidylinositol 3-kinase